MRLGKVEASGYIADLAEEEVPQEPQTQAPASPEPAVSEREQVPVTG